MPISVFRAAGAVAARLGRAAALGSEPISLIRLPARVRRRVAGSS